jgi:purine-nucleoside phosphorylase
MGNFEEVDAAAGLLRQRLGEVADVAVVLGSGLGAFTERLDRRAEIAYADIPNWPPVGVIGHAGRLVAGTLRDRRLLVLSGRAHLYEGHPPGAVTFATRVVGCLRVPVLVLTNAAGGINPAFGPGTLMIVDDHINLMGSNPLTGPHDPRFGDRFPDMSEVYSARLRRLADEAARAARVEVAHGVYVAVAGPSYETPAEIRACRALGADAVGMSTVPEAIVARQMGLEVLAVSCIANMAAGMLPQPLSADEVIATAGRVGPIFGDLLEETIARL